MALTKSSTPVVDSVKAVAYYRVSTDRQGRSGLGLDAQRADVQTYIAGQRYSLVGEYQEIETGKRHVLDNRPQLRAAIARAKRAKAVLVVAKLDRLLRSTVVCALLKTSGVRFVACDNPHANELTVDILACVAEDEVRRVSARTKAALAAYKARGGVLGSHRPESRNLDALARRKGAKNAGEAHKRNADEAYCDLQDYVTNLRQAGMSLPQIAARLNIEGQCTRRGKLWNPMQVSRVLARRAV